MRQADAAIAGRLVKVVPRNRVRAVYRYRVQRVYESGAASAGRSGHGSSRPCGPFIAVLVD